MRDTSERRLKRCRLATLVEVLAGVEGLAGGSGHHKVERLCVPGLEGRRALADACVSLRVRALVGARYRMGALVLASLTIDNGRLHFPTPPIGHE